LSCGHKCDDPSPRNARREVSMSEGKLRPWAVSVFGVVTVVIGALLNHFLSVSEKRTSLLDDARREAYVKVLDEIEEPANVTTAKADKEKADKEAAEAEKSGAIQKAQELRKRADELDAKYNGLDAQWVRAWKVAVNQLAVYGDSGVIRALADFDRRNHRHPESCGTEWKRDVQLYQEMRGSLLPNGQGASDKDLADLIMMCTATD